MRGRWLLWALASLGLGCQSAPPAPVPVATAAPASEFALAGTSWLAEDIDGRGVVDRVESTLIFESGARVVGSTGCNRYFAPLEVTGSTLRVGMAASTRRACPEPVMDQERRFLAALDAVRSYRREGPLLLLLDTGGRTVLRMSPQ
ncbi:MAG: META domain-containing protein [Candidatus Rokubacteria bacterium]|nr:META domain-containing protein [Candidatus Rokubacteria bacterium]